MFMANDIVHVMFDIPKDIHRRLKVLSLQRECTLRSMLQEAVQTYVSAAPEFGETQNEAEYARQYTLDELCETVFYLSRYAECLEINKAITVPDERELLSMIQEWSKDFEHSFDPSSVKDYATELESQGTQWLMKTFPYIPELDDPRAAIVDFIRFEESTAVTWPWAVSAEDLLQNEEILLELEKVVDYDKKSGFDTEKLYDALDQIIGINPALASAQEENRGMTMPDM